MKKILFLFISLFAIVPSMAKMCMSNNSIIMTTQAQVTDLSEGVPAELTALEARIAALENPSVPTVDLSWMLSWVNANDALDNYTINYNNSQNGTWSVTSNQSGATQTVSGVSRCSSTSGTFPNPGYPSDSSGYYCWCKMENPRAGAWAFNSGQNSLSNCATICAYNCAFHVNASSSFRAVVLSLP